jgi:putative tricarboxylic transport membrane protein
VLVLFGLYLLAQGLRGGEMIEGNWSLRALIVLPLSLVMFGLLMDHAGFVPALMALIVGSAAAGSEFKLTEALLLAAGLTAFAVLLFVWGLGLPYPLIAGW